MFDIDDFSVQIPSDIGDCNTSVPDVGGCGLSIGCQDYEQMNNLPKINGVELIGDRSSSEIHVQHEMDRITEQQIDNIIY